MGCPTTSAQEPLHSSMGPVALRTVPSREELLGSPCHSSKMSRKPSLTQSSTKSQRSTYFSHLSGTCAGCTSIPTQSPCLPAERGAGIERDVSIHAAHPTCRKGLFLQHNPTCCPSQDRSSLVFHFQIGILTLKEIFIRYSTPSFSTNACFL